MFLYPSVRFFWTNNQVIRDFSVGKGEEVVGKNNSHLLGQQYEGDLDSTLPLMKGLLRTLLDHWNKDVPSSWPSLPPIEAASKSELITKIHFRQRTPLILLIDDSQSFLGPQVILDFSPFQDKVTIVWLSHVSNDLNHRKLLKELLPQAQNLPHLPVLIEIDPITYQTNLLCWYVDLSMILTIDSFFVSIALMIQLIHFSFQ